jgi:zinc transport system substrate-binding protein
MTIIVMRVLIVLFLACVLPLSGCAAFSEDGGAPGSKGSVDAVAAFYPLHFVTQRVAGDHAQVANLTKPGGEPHDLEIPPGETARVTDADVVVFERGFQPAVDDAIDQNATGLEVDAAKVVELERADHDEHEEGHGDEGHEDKGHEDKGHEDESEHDHGQLDPHFWLDPLRMAELADAVAEALGEADPGHAEDYDANAADLRADLEAIDRSYEQGLASCERSTVVVSHDAFGYLSKYGLDMEPIAGLSPGAEPTPADLARLQDLIRADGITTVFSERLVSPRVSQSLADDAGVETAVLDPIEGLSDDTSDEDYLSLMRANLAALEKASGCR